MDLVFEKMIKLILGKKEAENLFFEFDKVQPLSKEDEIEILYKDETVYTLTVLVDEKTLAYGMDKLRRESLKKLAKKIAADFEKDFSAR